MKHDEGRVEQGGKACSSHIDPSGPSGREGVSENVSDFFKKRVRTGHL